MIMDKMTQLEDSSAVKLSTNLSVNVIDLQAPGGFYEDAMFVVLQVTEVFNTATTVQVDVVTADNAALSTNPVTVASTGQVTLSGSLFATLNSLIVIPLVAQTLKRYVGLKWTTTGSANSTGKVTAYVTQDIRMVGQAFIGTGSTATNLFTK
jgi:hypothetical protein